MSEIAVVGAGAMGVDVAITFACYGYNVLLKDVNVSVLESAPDVIRKKLRMYGMMSTALRNFEADDILSRIQFTEDYSHFDRVSWVIENVTEDWETKKKVYSELRDVCKPETRYAVNTSCLSITKIASLMPYPQNIIGMHFMNPVPLKHMVESVRGYHTSDETIQASQTLLQSIKKTTILVADSPGFVSNRLSHLFMNEAAFLVQENVASPEQIDQLFRHGYAHKMGPLETADLIGLDTVVHSLQVLYEDFQDPKFKCCPLLVKMVNAGLLGRKSGQGFYTY